MSNQTISTRPLSDQQKLMREKLYECITGQSDLMNKLSERLLTLELAIPGLYVTVLKLVRREYATVIANSAFYVTFGCWLAALILTLMALTPKKWVVDPEILKQDPKKLSEGLGIEDFFERSALYKRRLVIASSVLFFVGILSTVFTLG
jgi:hypothetical protein